MASIWRIYSQICCRRKCTTISLVLLICAVFVFYHIKTPAGTITGRQSAARRNHVVQADRAHARLVTLRVEPEEEDSRGEIGVQTSRPPPERLPDPPGYWQAPDRPGASAAPAAPAAPAASVHPADPADPANMRGEFQYSNEISDGKEPEKSPISTTILPKVATQTDQIKSFKNEDQNQSNDGGFKIKVEVFNRDWTKEELIPAALENKQQIPRADKSPDSKANDLPKSEKLAQKPVETDQKKNEVKAMDAGKVEAINKNEEFVDLREQSQKKSKSEQVDVSKTKPDFAKNLELLSPKTEAPPAGDTVGKITKQLALAGYELPPGVELVNHKMSVNSEGGTNIHTMLQQKGVIPAFPIHEGMPRRIQFSANTWQVVQDSWEIYLFSAWYDDRETLEEPAVRVIAVAEEATKHVYCLHWYPEQKMPDAALADVTAVGPKIVPIGNKKYEQYMISCNLVPGKGKPKYVSIITPNNVVPSTLLPVQQADKHPDRTLEFGHCMSVVYWHHDPIRVVEWLEFNKMMGVGEVTVYNNSLSDDVSAVFLHYQKEGYVDFRQAPNVIDHPSEFMILLNMSPVINDCFYRNMYRYKRVVCFDLDEMIIPRGFANYRELLEATDKKLNLTHPHQSYMFRNAYFFDDFKPAHEEPWFLWTQRYLKRVKPSQFGYSVKSITDPMTCVGLQNHVCWKRVPKYEDTAWNVEVPPKFAMNQHYKRCHFDKYLKEEGACSRMMKDVYMDKAALQFGGVLYDRVAKKLLDLDMADEADEKERADVVNKLKEAHNDLAGLENALS